MSSDMFRDLSTGGLDLALYVDASVPDALRKQFLFEENYSCVCRQDHPLLQRLTDGTIPMEEYLAWPHALVTVFGGRHGLIDTILKQRGLERHIALRLPYFSTAPLIVARSDMLLTLPTRTAEYFSSVAGLHSLTAPVEIPGFFYHQVWHQRTETDKAMIWLRQLIKNCSDITALSSENSPGTVPEFGQGVAV